MTQGNGHGEIKQTDLAEKDKWDLVFEILAQIQEDIAELSERVNNINLGEQGYSEFEED